ncbi:ParA family protein, partial [Vibrio breoganii]|uniref:ParA family protein n=2 Tax=Vibrionaceae TaxID=641 RepID=UPI0039A6A9A3
DYTSRELQRLGHTVNVQNTDQQQHVELITNENATIHLYDTAGSFTQENLDLLNAAAQIDDVKIVIPITTGARCFKEVPFILDKMHELNLSGKYKFVFSKVRRPLTKGYYSRRKQLQELDAVISKWSLPLLEDFSEDVCTSNTKKEISQFIHEVIL